jgi:lipopolysaccharide biosynthesis glycosyltransferase
MIDDFFMVGFEVFMKSLLKTNPWFDLPFRLIDVGLNKKNKEKCLEIYSNIEFVKPKKENYKKISFEKTHEILWNTYYKLDIFSYDDVDRLVFLDLDMIVLEDIKKLFEFTVTIGGCKGYSQGNDSLRKDMNTGCIVLNKPVLNNSIYKNILDYTAKAGGFSMPDQKAIGQFFKNKIAFIPKEFDCEKRLWKGDKFKLFFNDKNELMYKEGKKISKCKILHYVSEKPWQEKKDKINFGYEELEKLWWNVKNE